jgi:NifU-like protein involved in Fe-S cluster formation
LVLTFCIQLDLTFQYTFCKNEKLFAPFQAGSIRNSDIAKELCLPPVKLHCSMLAEDAIKAALKDYKVKKERKTE